MTINADAAYQRRTVHQPRLANPGGAPIHLSDVADVEEQHREPEHRQLVRRQTRASSWRSSASRTPTRSPWSMRSMRNCQHCTPRYRIGDDAGDERFGQADHDAISDVKFTLFLTIGSSFLVIYLFTGHQPVTLIPGLAVPLSLITTFRMMYVWATASTASLLGADARRRPHRRRRDRDAGILRHVERDADAGKSGDQGLGRGQLHDRLHVRLADRGVHPDLLMGGVVGRIFSEFGMVVAIAIVASSRRVADGDADAGLSGSAAAIASHPSSSAGSTPASSGRCAATTAPLAAVPGAPPGHSRVVSRLDRPDGLPVRPTLPTSFFPTEDIGRLNIPPRPPGHHYPAMKDLQNQAAALVKQEPGSQRHVDRRRQCPRSPLSSGTMFVELKDKKDRPPARPDAARTGASISKIPGLQAFMRRNQSLRLAGNGRQPISAGGQALSADQTNLWANKIQQAMPAIRATDVTSDAQNNALQADIKGRHEKGRAAFGITDDQLRTTLQEAFGGYAAAQIQSTGDSYDVLVEYDTNAPWDDQKLPGHPRGLVERRAGSLSNATVQRTTGPVTINQTGQLVSTTVSFNLPAGQALDDATAAIDQIEGHRHASGRVPSYGGTAQIFEQSPRGQPRRS